VNRIAQHSATATEYFSPDALGSVRQLTSGSNSVTLTRSYQPYGTVLSSTGAGTTSYSFVGEWQDATSLIHLRARYYSVRQGRFITRDPWRGDYRRPLTLNGWNYSFSNPVNYTDPSGHCPKGWKPNPDGTCSFTFTFTTLPFSGPFGFRIKSRTITIPFPKEWCENETSTQQQPTATATPQPKPTPTPSPPPCRGLKEDERTHIQRIDAVKIEEFILKHPWALTEPASGGHYIEALQLEARLINSITTLLSARNLCAAEQSEVNRAIADGTAKLIRLQTWLSARTDYKPRPIPK
jgi:RHS repeat-associated protein